MNDDLQKNSFDELLSAALEDYVDDQPRPGLDRRILANLPARRPMRWALWPALITVSALALAIVSLHLHRQPTPAVITAGVPHDHGAPSVASADVIVGTISSPHSRANQKARPAAIPLTTTPAVNAGNTPSEASSRPEAQPQWRDPRISPSQPPTTSAETEPSTQTPTIAANGEIKIEPIHITPLVIPPIPTAEAATQPIPPIKVEPIKIDPIQVSSLDIDRPNPNE